MLFFVNRAGYVLVGGKSSRMGRDKALLPYRGSTLAKYIADAARAAAGSATLVGEPARFAHLGFRVIPDSVAGAGPLGGIHAALRDTTADWNLILACDMPEVSMDFLSLLITRAEASEADAFIPAGPSGRPEPLCAVYHRRALPAFEAALARGVRKVMEAVECLPAVSREVIQVSCFQNVNTPEEWAGYACR
jgi:molybdopterin-guanine dinucleotide biosynthesis protein A